MSLLEVLKSVDELARAYQEKTKVLDQLKSEYEGKLALINKYIETLPKEDSQALINDEELLNRLKEPVACKNCNNTVWNNGEGNMVLLPRSCVKVPESSKDPKDPKNPKETDDMIRRLQLIQIHPSTPNHNSRANKNSSKRVCSYCQKKGHSRAKCFARLNGEKPVYNHETNN